MRVPSTSTPRTRRPAATWRRPSARRCRTTRHATAEWWRRTRGRAHRRAAPSPPRTPVPPVPRPRGPCALGRAVVAAAPRDRWAAAQDRGPHQLRREDVRPDLRPPRRPGLPRRRRGARHRARGAAAPALHREGPPRRRVPPRGRLALPRPALARRRRVHAHPRAAARGRRPGATMAERRRARGTRPHARHLVGPRGRRGGAGPANDGAPDPGIAWAVHRWASGRPLEDVLRGTELAAGDFVRRCKQVIDLLGQLTDAGDRDLQRVARKASDAVLRGVVAADRLD